MPTWTASGTANYSHPLPFFGLTGDASTTYTWVDEQGVVFQPVQQYTTLTNQPIEFKGLTIPGYSLLKANLGVGRDGWHVQIFGDNLLDKRAIVAIAAPIPQYTVITPRTAGLRLSYDF
jgi:hypothetical protein